MSNPKILAVLIGGLLTTGCSNDKSKDSSPECTDAPMADAGEDQAVELGGSVSLNGTLSTYCSTSADSLLYNWSFIQAPVDSAVDESSLSDNRTNSAVTPLFTPDVVGDYTLGLMLTDENGDSTEDIVVISVASGDQAPVADCGGSYSGNIGEVVEIDGTASSDPEGAELEYSWSLSPSECSELETGDLYNQNSSNPSFVPDCAGYFVISLVVSDGGQWSEPSTCTIEVGSENQVPVADAGDGGDMGACIDNPLTLNGFGSYDLDGDDLSFEWSVVSVPDGSAVDETSFNDRTLVDPELAWDIAGDYTLQLQVSDGIEWSAPDVVSLTIADESDNSRPIANAGDDQEVDTEVDCESSSYVWSCPNCEVVPLSFDGSSSRDNDGDDLTYLWTESTGSISFASAESVITDAEIAEQVAEYGVDNSLEFEIELTVSDCSDSDDDSISVTYTCSGESP